MVHIRTDYSIKEKRQTFLGVASLFRVKKLEKLGSFGAKIWGRDGRGPSCGQAGRKSAVVFTHSSLLPESRGRARRGDGRDEFTAAAVRVGPASSSDLTVFSSPVKKARPARTHTHTRGLDASMSRVRTATNPPSPYPYVHCGGSGRAAAGFNPSISESRKLRAVPEILLKRVEVPRGLVLYCA